MNAFIILLHAHTHVWQDRNFPLQVRMEACKILWDLAISLEREK